MAWSVESRSVVDLPSGFTIGGQKALGGVTIECQVQLQFSGWPQQAGAPQRPLALVLRPALCKFRFDSGELAAPIAHPASHQLIQIPPQSLSQSVRYDLYLSNAALTELEEMRSAGVVRMDLCLGAFSLISPVYSDQLELLTYGPNQTQMEWISANIPKEDWLKVLDKAGFAETLLFEVPIKSTVRADIEKAQSLLKRAMKRRSEGHPADVVADTRKVVDAIYQSGFGGKAPKKVAAFLAQDMKNMSMEERFSVLQIALKAFASPAHHVHIDGDDFTRADADMALALAAALVRLAPTRSSKD